MLPRHETRVESFRVRVSERYGLRVGPLGVVSLETIDRDSINLKEDGRSLEGEKPS